MALCMRQFCLKNYSLFWQSNQLKTVNGFKPVLINIATQKYSLARSYSKKQNVEKPSLLQRFKEMYRSYWYVLVPVHLVTSAAWFGGFYYLAKSGVDIVGILESWNVSDKITNTLKDSSMGYIAVSYALYKISTPLRYTVTLGGTTLSINYLKQWGYIKPVPSKDELKVMYKEHKNNLLESFKETRDFYKKREDIVKNHKKKLTIKKEIFKKKKGSLVEDLEKSWKDIRHTNSNLSSKSNINLNKKNGTH